jgi:transposase InsO family protein
MEHPRYGYRRVTALLRADGWVVNRKRVHRLWKSEGLKVPAKQGKTRRRGGSGNGVSRRRPVGVNEVWTYDFVSDRTEDGRALKLLVVLDEFTRENLALEVGRSMRSDSVLATLEMLFLVRGVPRHIRSDNGPEFVAAAVRGRLEQLGVGTLFIAPGSPWENAYIESFNSRLRDEVLNREAFGSVLEAEVVLSDWRMEYNHRRPHSALGYRTPAAFAAASVPPGSAAPRLPERSRSHSNLTLTTRGT